MMDIVYAKISKIGKINTIVLPIELSKELPSRGMVMVEGTINNIPLKVALEPDGKGSHWFEVSDKLIEDAKLELGKNIEMKIKPMKTWFEPEVPEDLIYEIEKANLMDQWQSISTKARWDWIRWIRSTANLETRKKRINVACSKLEKGDRNPCCFDRTRCTIPELSKSGILLES